MGTSIPIPLSRSSMIVGVVLVGAVLLLGAHGYEKVDNEIIENIPGMTRDKYGNLLYNGEEVVSINGIGTGPEEVVDMEEVESSSPVEKMDEVVGQAEVESLRRVYDKRPVISKQEIARMKELANMLEVLGMQEVDAQEVVGMDEVLNMEEVTKIQPVRVQEVPEDVFEEFNEWRFPIEEQSTPVSARVEQISSLLELKRKELVVRQEELRSMLRVIKKLELTYVAEIEEMEEVARMQEVKAEEVKATELKNVQEITKMMELTPKEAAKLKALLANQYKFVANKSHYY